MSLMGTPSRLTYERLGVLVTDSPAYKQNGGSKFKNLIRLQSMEYSFSHPSIDVKTIGSDSLVTRNGESPIVRQPDVNCNMSYLFSAGQNEEAAGFYIGNDGSFLKNFLQSSSDDISVIAVASNEDRHKDLNHISQESEFDGYNVIGIGNCFLTNYRYEASVGSLPNASFTYAGSNMKFDHYNPSDKPTLPSMKLGVDNQKSLEEIALSGSSFDPQEIEGANAIMPGDVVIDIDKAGGGHGGSPLESVSAAIQNISIDIPLPRQDIYGFGSNYVFDRKLQLPIIASASIDMNLREFATGEIDSFFVEGAKYDMTISHTDTYFQKGQKKNRSVISSFEIDDAQLKTQSFSKSIGNNASVSTEFSFGISSEKGFRMSNNISGSSLQEFTVGGGSYYNWRANIVMNQVGRVELSNTVTFDAIGLDNNNYYDERLGKVINSYNGDDIDVVWYYGTGQYSNSSVYDFEYALTDPQTSGEGGLSSDIQIVSADINLAGDQGYPTSDSIYWTETTWAGGPQEFPPPI